jgi:flagellar biosynthetic protein FliQ
MTETFVLTVGRDAVLLTLLIAAPMLGTSLIVGLVISIFQAVTQINEMTLTFVPKLIGFALVIILLGSWMLQHLLEFTLRIFNMLPYMVR